MLRKKRLKCGRIPARLFLACHQKSNTFKCKQFCCAKPMCACLSAGCAPRHPQRRAAVHSTQLSVSSSAHSPVNSLRSNNTCSCVLLRKPFPRSSYLVFKHCGAAMGNLIIKINRVTRFYFTINRQTSLACFSDSLLGSRIGEARTEWLARSVKKYNQ